MNLRPSTCTPLAFLLLACCLLLTLTAQGQQTLANSRTTSYFTYIYNITDPEAKVLYEKGMHLAKESFFHSKVDSFPTGLAYQKRLPQGHYLITHASGADLIYELKSQAHFQVHLLQNQVDLALVVHNSLGTILPSAQVWVKQKKIPFDQATQTYRLPGSRKEGLLTIKYQGFTFYQPLDRQAPGRPILKKIVYSPPVYFFWKPFKDIVNSLEEQEPQGFVRKVFALFDDFYEDGSSYDKHQLRGFIALNKPMYLPGDTVRYKAYLLQKNGKPYQKLLRAEVTGTRKTKVVGTLRPYRPGAYEGSFVLHDSLQLRLDSYVSLDLVKPNKKEDQEVKSAYFRYEDYELKENTYRLWLSQKEHFSGTPNQILMRGTDANGLNLPDARVELKVITSLFLNSPNPAVFIPDTLWSHTQALAATGETTVSLPDSIFPNASLRYRVEATFLNSSNERSTQTTTGNYLLLQKGQLQFTLLQDSIQAIYLEGGVSKPKEATLILSGKNNEVLQEFKVMLPTILPLQPFAKYYQLKTDQLQTSLQPEEKGPNIDFLADRTSDSLFLTVQNPRRLPFWYFIYRNEKLVDRGQDTTTFWSRARKIQGNEPYYVSLQYVWAGQIQQKEYGAPIRHKELNIAVEAPATVYPGQQTSLTLSVTDFAGKPAADVDLTAYALTSKFKNASPPSAPFFGYYKGRKSRSKFNLVGLEPEATKKLDWNRWSHEMGLDSLAYYQLLFPAQGVFTHHSFSPDSLTQFAPFVVDSGRVVPVHVIYLDEIPVYFSGTNVKPAYSFPADSGFHTLKLRTARHLITIDSLYLKHRQKLILSIDQNKMPQLLATAEKHVLSPAERNHLSNFLLPVEQNFNKGIVYLHQGNRVQQLPPGSFWNGNITASTRYSTLLAGPFLPDSLYFRHLGNFATGFVPEVNYIHRFEPGLLKMRQKETLPEKPNLTSAYQKKLDRSILGQTALTHAQLLTHWENQEADSWLSEIISHPFRGRQQPGEGRLSWQLDSTIKQTPQYAFLFPPKSPADSVRIFRGSTSLVGRLQPGNFHLVLVFADQRQISVPVTIQPNGLVHLNLSSGSLKASTVQSRTLSKLVQQRIVAAKAAALQAQKPQPSTPPRVIPLNSGAGLYKHTIRGKVVDAATKEPIPGVSVIVKGTTVGAVTDISGEYTINAPNNGTLAFSFIGFKTEEVDIKGNSVINVTLNMDSRQLNEVVVTGYAVQEKRELTAAVATVHTELNGRVAGVALGRPGSVNSVQVRGLSSIYGNSTASALIIVDGLPFSGQMGDIDPQTIASITILKEEQATATYGTAGVNGVIIITTKKGKAEATQAFLASNETDASASIRSYFSDYAFWQPRLTTDKQGKVTFPVTFPGDVTSWKAHVIAMDGNKRSGQTTTEILSFKAMMATLSGPRFLIEGDKAQIIGKAVNYLPDTAAVNTRFELNGKLLREKQLNLGRVATDSFMVQAPAVAPDSVELLYSLQQGNGFADGERRYIGVYKKGVLERKGVFLSLPIDTTLTLSFDPAKGPVHFYAQSNLFQVMLDEIKYLHQYEYWCNEQAASKLKGLLWEKRIQAALGKEFEHDRVVRRLIRHLEKTQKQDGTWSWWENGPAYLWISHHVTEALVLAQTEGYTTTFKKQTLIDYLTYQVEKKDGQDRIRALEILQQLNGKVDFAAYIPQLEKQKHLSLEDQLRLTRLRQKLQMKAPLDTLNSYRQTTTLGGLYWGRERSSLFDSHISNTLLAYEILKSAGGHERDLLKIQAFLLNERRTGHWRNTYESARILETLLPDLVKEKGQIPENQLLLSGGVNASLNKFPADTTFTPTQPLTITKKGTMALYLTAYQNEWIAQPERVEKDFVVKTRFAGTGSTQATLVAGKPVELEVEVYVKNNASYVMIEVPIPAGCSYDTKASRGSNEAHREYFRHKVAIFSNHLSAGPYTFTIKLLPRYKGTYTLNPARAELMYFPTFFGREGLKTVEVK